MVGTREDGRATEQSNEGANAEVEERGRKKRCVFHSVGSREGERR